MLKDFVLGRLPAGKQPKEQKQRLPAQKVTCSEGEVLGEVQCKVERQKEQAPQHARVPPARSGSQLPVATNPLRA